MSTRQRIVKPYNQLFNHDGFCVFSNASKYQSIDEPVGLAQVHGYVDEVADAGCDVLLLCPNMYQLPGWNSDHYPFWKNEGKTVEFSPDTVVGKIFHRAREFYFAGNDLIQLSLDRAREKGIDFFLSWRMNECHGVDNPNLPVLSKFWKEYPEFRIGSDPVSWEEMALSFAHKEVRDYHFGFIRELCERYDIDGLELDFLRFPWYFPRTMPFSEKAPIMTGYVKRVRNMLDELGKDIPICVRVFNRPDLVKAMGQDLGEWACEGLIDMVNISPFFINQPGGDVEGFRKKLPSTAIYAELTQCAGTPQVIELSTEVARKSTTEHLRSTAYSFLDRGADGISFFNFVYYRDYSFGDPKKLDKTEPNFAALKDIRNMDKLAEEEKHYYVNENNGCFGDPLIGELPVTFSVGKTVELKIHVADDFSRQDIRDRFGASLLRIQGKEASLVNSTIESRLDDTLLEETIHEGELFPQPYKGGIPDTHDNYKDFVVPVHKLKRGWNVFAFRLTEGDDIVLDRMELALYHSHATT